MTMPSSDQPTQDSNPPYGGLSFDRSPGGFDYVVVPWVVSGMESRVRLIAILGLKGCAVEDAAKYHHFAEAHNDSLSAATTLACFTDYAKWPAVEDGELVLNHRRDRHLALELHPRDFRSQALGMTVKDGYPQRLNEVLGKQSALPSPQTREVSGIAKWNFSKLEYGDPTDDARETVKKRAKELVAEFRESKADEPRLQTEIEAGRDKRDLALLAAWVELLVAGSHRLHETVRLIQRKGMEEITEWNSEGLAPTRVGVALEEGSGLHHLFYDPQPEFGDDTWIWGGRGPHTVGLRSPRLIGIARTQLGDSWWQGLVRAFAKQEQDAIESGLGRLRQLNATLATRAMVDRQDITPDESDGVEFVDLDDSLPARRRPTQDIETQVQATLRPRLWEVYRRIEFEEEPAKDVAASLGVSPGRVSQMLSEAKRGLARDQKLRDMWEDGREVAIHPSTPRRPTT